MTTYYVTARSFHTDTVEADSEAEARALVEAGRSTDVDMGEVTVLEVVEAPPLVPVHVLLDDVTVYEVTGELFEGIRGALHLSAGDLGRFKGSPLISELILSPEMIGLRLPVLRDYLDAQAASYSITRTERIGL